MTSTLVDGHLIPDAVAGHPGVELCNTRAGWGEPGPKEYLDSYAALALWARENRLITPAECSLSLAEAARRPTLAKSVLAEALELRDCLYTVFTDRSLPERATRQVRDFVTSAVRESRYGLDPERGSLLLDGGSGLAIPVHRSVLAANRLLESQGPSAVGRCAGQGCGWLFFDPTQRRRWCIMAVCGNRAKVRRYAERHRPAQ
jgi:predicted RNA-binding Zn ribbon-like protein